MYRLLKHIVCLDIHMKNETIYCVTLNVFSSSYNTHFSKPHTNTALLLHIFLRTDLFYLFDYLKQTQSSSSSNCQTSFNSIFSVVHCEYLGKVNHRSQMVLKMFLEKNSNMIRKHLICSLVTAHQFLSCSFMVSPIGGDLETHVVQRTINETYYEMNCENR